MPTGKTLPLTTNCILLIYFFVFYWEKLIYTSTVQFIDQIPSEFLLCSKYNTKFWGDLRWIRQTWSLNPQNLLPVGRWSGQYKAFINRVDDIRGVMGGSQTWRTLLWEEQCYKRVWRKRLANSRNWAVHYLGDDTEIAGEMMPEKEGAGTWRALGPKTSHWTWSREQWGVKEVNVD